jgi:hypothetical protein
MAAVAAAGDPDRNSFPITCVAAELRARDVVQSKPFVTTRCPTEACCRSIGEEKLRAIWKGKALDTRC